MARPVSKRNPDALTKEIQNLFRLRASLIIDDSVNSEDTERAKSLIDELTTLLLKLSKNQKAA